MQRGGHNADHDGQGVKAAADPVVSAAFHLPPPDLQRYFTTFYRAEITVPDDGRVSDTLHPEWANLRFVRGDAPIAVIDDGAPVLGTDFYVTGPTSRPARFTVGSTAFWGIGLMPLGWARFIAQPAADYADRVVDGRVDPAFAAFGPLADSVARFHGDVPAALEAIIAYFRGRLGGALPDHDRILAVHAAMVDPEVHSVGDFAARAGVQPRTLERLCCRHFGFTPKTLLRRQRFMRSVAQFILDPSRKWIGALDGHYHDQAQFVRDFHAFMGMSPREYASRPRPILETFVRERMRIAGSAVQTTDRPAGV
ncbi:helix-turn-helix domain-containing protein [Parablastomonas sp. CN1-191]|uniref:helix-turn-helix domain-containing protein n=1 Tax=Parablastomonas sp. CN1-191 TaxID=3400908 RepID=UPI003BF89572